MPFISRDLQKQRAEVVRLVLPTMSTSICTYPPRGPCPFGMGYREGVPSKDPSHRTAAPKSPDETNIVTATCKRFSGRPSPTNIDGNGTSIEIEGAKGIDLNAAHFGAEAE